jgi:hypothetical protein
MFISRNIGSEWEQNHQQNCRANRPLPNNKRELLADAVCQISDRQRHNQSGRAAGSHQVAKHCLVVPQAEHVKVEQELINPNGGPINHDANQVLARVRAESLYAREISPQYGSNAPAGFGFGSVHVILR